MRTLIIVVPVVVPVLLAFSAAALGQPRGPVTPVASSSDPADTLPSDYLRIAQSALTAGRIKEAEDALEKAQTRMLDHSVPLGQTNNPSDNPTIGQISQARQALAAHNKAACLELLRSAINSASAQRF